MNKEVLKGKPKVVCLCGSTRFAEWFMIKRWELEKQGIITFGINILPDNYFAEGNSHGAEQEGVKDVLDELHKRKIDLSDEVFILNVGGYIGESTSNELNYAIQTGKPVKYLEPPNSEPEVQASVATDGDSSTSDGKQNNSSNSGEQQPVTGELKRLKELLRQEFFINSRKVYGTKQWEDYCTENSLNYIDRIESNRCQHEVLVETFFGLAESVTEKTEIKTDFGQLVNLVAFASQPPTPEPGELHWKQRCDDLLKICEMVHVPQILRDYPHVLAGKPTNKDIEWAKEKIAEIKNQEVEPGQQK